MHSWYQMTYDDLSLSLTKSSDTSLIISVRWNTPGAQKMKFSLINWDCFTQPWIERLALKTTLKFQICFMNQSQFWFIAHLRGGHRRLELEVSSGYLTQMPSRWWMVRQGWKLDRSCSSKFRMKEEANPGWKGWNRGPVHEIWLSHYTSWRLPQFNWTELGG